MDGSHAAAASLQTCVAGEVLRAHRRAEDEAEGMRSQQSQHTGQLLWPEPKAFKID